MALINDILEKQGQNTKPPADGESETIDDHRFDLHWAAEAFDSPEEIEYIVVGLIGASSVNLVHGEGGAKKTWSMLDLAVCVALGKDWLNMPTKQCPVLLIDEEMGPKRLKNRLADVISGHFGKRELPLAFISLAQFNLQGDPDCIDALMAKIEECRAGLVIIDALADVMPGKDENAVKDVQPLMMNLRKVAENTGAAIIVIHHSNKQGGYRGSTALKGAVDLMLVIESEPDKLFIEFKVEKARDIVPVKFAAKANFVEGEKVQFYLEYCDVFVLQGKLGNAQEFVIRYLSNNEIALMRDIEANADSCGPKSARNAVYDFVRKGLIKRVDSGGSGETATYALTEKGVEFAETL